MSLEFRCFACSSKLDFDAIKCPKCQEYQYVGWWPIHFYLVRLCLCFLTIFLLIPLFLVLFLFLHPIFCYVFQLLLFVTILFFVLDIRCIDDYCESKNNENVLYILRKKHFALKKIYFRAIKQYLFLSMIFFFFFAPLMALVALNPDKNKAVSYVSQLEEASQGENKANIEDLKYNDRILFSTITLYKDSK